MPQLTVLQSRRSEVESALRAAMPLRVYTRTHQQPEAVHIFVSLVCGSVIHNRQEVGANRINKTQWICEMESSSLKEEGNPDPRAVASQPQEDKDCKGRQIHRNRAEWRLTGLEGAGNSFCLGWTVMTIAQYSQLHTYQWLKWLSFMLCTFYHNFF